MINRFFLYVFIVFYIAVLSGCSDKSSQPNPPKPAPIYGKLSLSTDVSLPNPILLNKQGIFVEQIYYGTINTLKIPTAGLNETNETFQPLPIQSVTLNTTPNTIGTLFQNAQSTCWDAAQSTWKTLTYGESCSISGLLKNNDNSGEISGTLEISTPQDTLSHIFKSIAVSADKANVKDFPTLKMMDIPLLGINHQSILKLHNSSSTIPINNISIIIDPNLSKKINYEPQTITEIKPNNHAEITLSINASTPLTEEEVMQLKNNQNTHLMLSATHTDHYLGGLRHLY